MGDLVEGVVVSHLGKGLAVLSNGATILCQTRRQMQKAAVGDRVLWTQTAKDQGRVEQILPRRSELLRPLRNGKTRVVAANIDRVLIVFAVKPVCDFLLLDQYLTVCENRNIEAVLIWNKQDLINPDSHQEIIAELQTYRQLGYPLLKISAKQNLGMDDLQQILQDKTSMLAGQSGVGKSSLSNVLLPEQQLKTNTLSANTQHGRHTTTAATLYPLPFGGALIDSPGVAVFGLAGINTQQLAFGYREFRPLLERCRFHNCRHQQDKGCAVRDAAENGTISHTRYERFLKLHSKMAVQD